MDPVAMLMDEYKRLTPEDAPAKPMFTPEQQNDRVNRNNNLADVGALGSLSGDRGARNLGGQVFKQALADRGEIRSQRGIVDPLTGEEALDPEYTRARQEDKRGQLLTRALAFQQQQLASQDRSDSAKRHDEILRTIGAGHDAARLAAKSAGGGEGKGHNLVQVTDEGTGEKFWSDPRTGNYVKPVTKQDGAPLVQPGKPTGNDDKELTAVNTGKSAIKLGLEAVGKHPDAFGPMKGIPDQLGDGVVGNATRYWRDNKSLSSDQLAARAAIYNQVSAIIKERAGTAQSKQELKRLQGFLPGEMDNAPAIEAKLRAFDAYLDERGLAVKSKYAGPRPMQHMGGPGGQPAQQQAPTAAPAAKGRLKFNPATGEIEDGE